MEEKVDLLDEFGRKTGQVITKKEAHEKGLYHRVTVVGVVDNNRNILMQKRSHDKLQFPDTWDISAAGHVSSGETSLISAVRELSEEVGIKVSEKDLCFLTSFRDSITHASGVIENEYFDVFVLNVPDLYNMELKMQKEELEDMQIMPFEEALKMARNHEVAAKEEAYEAINEYLERN